MRYVLVHGMGGAASIWDALALDDAVSLDLPGHGARAREAALTNVDDMADDVARSCARFAPFVIVGHSLGGAIAQSLMVRHASLVARAVVVSSALRFPTAPAMLKALEEDAASARAMFGDAIGGVAPVPRSRALFDACTDEVLRADLMALASFDARSFAKPAAMLVVGGDLDALTPPKAWRRLAEAWGARAVEITGAGHMLPEEAAGALADAIRTG